MPIAALHPWGEPALDVLAILVNSAPASKLSRKPTPPAYLAGQLLLPYSTLFPFRVVR